MTSYGQSCRCHSEESCPRLRTPKAALPTSCCGPFRPSAKVLMPRLKPWLSNPEHPRYVFAIGLLRTVGDGGSEAVPFLVQALQSTNLYHRIFAAESLEYFGVEARAAVPALIGALADPAI